MSRRDGETDARGGGRRTDTIEGGFRRSSRDDPIIVQGEQDEKPADTGAATYSPAPAQHSVRLRKASGMEPVGAPPAARPVDWPPAGGHRRRGRGE